MWKSVRDGTVMLIIDNKMQTITIIIVIVFLINTDNSYNTIYPHHKPCNVSIGYLTSPPTAGYCPFKYITIRTSVTLIYPLNTIQNHSRKSEYIKWEEVRHFFSSYDTRKIHGCKKGMIAIIKYRLAGYFGGCNFLYNRHKTRKLKKSYA